MNINVTQLTLYTIVALVCSYLLLYLYTYVRYRNHLRRVRSRAMILIRELEANHSKTFRLLIERFRPENVRFSLLASDPQERNYTLDKTVIYICPDNDLDATMFVLIHELAHMANSEYGHHEAFWTTFRELLDISEMIGVYNSIEFPQKFCGFKITRDFNPPM